MRLCTPRRVGGIHWDGGFAAVAVGLPAVDAKVQAVVLCGAVVIAVVDRSMLWFPAVKRKPAARKRSASSKCEYKDEGGALCGARTQGVATDGKRYYKRHARIVSGGTPRSAIASALIAGAGRKRQKCCKCEGEAKEYASDGVKYCKRHRREVDGIPARRPVAKALISRTKLRRPAGH